MENNDIITRQQAEIDHLNLKLIEQVNESARLREQLAAAEDRLRFPGAPMSQSTGMRCVTCFVKAGDPHTAGCTESNDATAIESAAKAVQQ